MTVKVYGLHAAGAVLRASPERITAAHAQAGRADARLEALLEQARAANVPVRIVPREVLDGLSGKGSHQGIVLECNPAGALPESALRDRVQRDDGALLLLVLDGITDPHNLGACLRTAAAAGADMVLAPRDRAAGLTPAARKVASGAAETVPFVQVTNLARTLRWLRDAGVWVAGMAGEVEQDLFEAELPPRLALVLGAEGKGLRRLTRENCDLLMRIPMAGSVDSVNVSVAAGICLFEVNRRRTHP